MIDSSEFQPAVALGPPVPIRPTRAEQFDLKSLITALRLDEDKIRNQRERMFGDRDLSFAAFNASYPCFPIELTYLDGPTKAEGKMTSFADWWRRPTTTVECRTYYKRRLTHWECHPELRGRSFGMIFKSDNLLSILMHDLKIIDPWSPRWHYLGTYARSVLSNRHRRPWANAHIYLDNWKTFVALLRREWRPIHVPELDARLASQLSIDPGPQLKDMMRAR